MADSSSTFSTNSTTTTTTAAAAAAAAIATTSIDSLLTTQLFVPVNGSIFDIIAQLTNGTGLYSHQSGNLIEPEKYSAVGAHLVIWISSIVTYLLAIPVSIRLFRSRAYSNVIDYFTAHILLCAFIAWIPALILLLHHWFEIFTLRFCYLHYVLLLTNETVGFSRIRTRSVSHRSR
jgi:hypothetical protein